MNQDPHPQNAEMTCHSDEIAEAFRALSWTVTRLALLVSMSVNGASTNKEGALYKQIERYQKLKRGFAPVTN
jgi:hypothetical protein